ncbi:MAG TPA: diaminopimelate epimerase [Cyclobacteriaceae bacterium]
MRLDFFKYQGAGNDFIIIDQSSNDYPSLNSASISYLCDRNFGIGSDGLIIITSHTKADFNLDFYNPDGTRSFCGNGSRCAVKHFYKVIKPTINLISFYACDGLHHGIQNEDQSISINLKDIDHVQWLTTYEAFVNTGSPHHIVFCEDITSIDVVKTGGEIRYSEKYRPEGTNVNFVQRQDNDRLEIRTYERGVENETMSCGTGITASALALGAKTKSNSIHVKSKGGNLKVTFQQKSNGRFTNIWLTGPAVQVFNGTIEI